MYRNNWPNNVTFFVAGSNPTPNAPFLNYNIGPTGSYEILRCGTLDNCRYKNVNYLMVNGWACGESAGYLTSLIRSMRILMGGLWRHNKAKSRARRVKTRTERFRVEMVNNSDLYGYGWTRRFWIKILSQFFQNWKNIESWLSWHRFPRYSWHLTALFSPQNPFIFLCFQFNKQFVKSTKLSK